MTGGGGLGGLGIRGGTLFSSPPAAPANPFALPFPKILEVGVAAVPGEEEREPGEAPVVSGSRKDAMEDSRRREGIFDCDLAPGGPRGLLCPSRSVVSVRAHKPKVNGVLSHISDPRKRCT